MTFQNCGPMRQRTVELLSHWSKNPFKSTKNGHLVAVGKPHWPTSIQVKQSRKWLGLKISSDGLAVGKPDPRQRHVCFLPAVKCATSQFKSSFKAQAMDCVKMRRRRTREERVDTWWRKQDHYLRGSRCRPVSPGWGGSSGGRKQKKKKKMKKLVTVLLLLLLLQPWVHKPRDVKILSRRK